jgi:beta-lactamase regulating signal transducer with metallopeptidase domain
MSVMNAWLNSPEVDSFVLALGHSLWQGGVWVGILFASYRLIPASRNDLRYGAAISCLLGLVLTMLVTWNLLHREFTFFAQVPKPTHHRRTNGSESTQVEPQDAHPAMAPPWGMDAAKGPKKSGQTLVHDGDNSNHVSSRKRSRTARLTAVGAVLWGLGSFLVFTRNIRHCLAARDLARDIRNGYPCQDPALFEMFQDLVRRLAIKRPVGLLMTRQITVPAVWGILQPVVLLPPSILTGFSPTELQAILAHELAHVRRWDSLVNVWQMVVESLFFFNPAVWWLSRQIRVEREACCDALATEIISEKHVYAEALVRAAISNFSPAIPAPLLTMSSRDGHVLLDRVQRLLTPGYRPAVHFTWLGTTMWLLVTLGLMAILQRGTDLGVTLASQLLTDTERIEQLTKEARDLSPELTGPLAFDKVRISGTLEYAEHVRSDHPASISVYVRGVGGASNLMASLGSASEGKFSVEVQPGTIWLFFTGEDFAPSILGPFDARDGPVITDQVVKLKRGEVVPVFVKDAEGTPAEGVELGISVVVRGTGPGVGTFVTNEQGEAILTEIDESLNYLVSLRGPGFQTSRSTRPLRVGQPLHLTIDRAHPATGQVFGPSNEPLADVTLKNFAHQRLSHDGTVEFTHRDGIWGDVLATSNEEGQFQLDQLLDGHVYYLLIEHPDYAHQVFGPVRSGQANLAIQFESGFSIHGKVTGLAEVLEGLAHVHWIVKWPSAGADFPDTAPQGTIKFRIPLEVEKGLGTFTIPHFVGHDLQLQVAEHQTRFRVSPESPNIEVDLLDLRNEVRQMRPVVFKFSHQGRDVEPDGKLMVSRTSPHSRAGTNEESAVARSSNRFVLDVAPGTRISARPDGLIGYWFSPHQVEWPEVTEGDEPLEILTPVVPAGAVKGVVIQPDGQPAAGVGVTLNLRLETAPEDAPDGRSHSYSGGLQARTDTRGQFFLSPVPWGATCRLAVSDGFYRQVDPVEFTLDAERTIHSAKLQMGTQREVTGMVFDPVQPLRGVSVTLVFDHPQAGMEWGPPVQTDRFGRFRFDGIHTDAEDYFAVIESRKDYVPTRFALRCSQPNLIQLERGLVLEGRAVDLQGQPVAGVEVTARRVDSVEGRHVISRFEAESVTDAEGRFRFSNLPADRVRLEAAQLWERNDPVVLPGGGNEVELRGKVVPWFAKASN